MNAAEARKTGDGRLEAERRAFLALVKASATLATPRDIAERVVAVARHLSGCEAVAVRLQSGPDHPYAAAQGFPSSFLMLESRLCQEDGAGHLVRDAQRHPVLACVCGAVISGTLPETLPWRTQGGAFWTNSTSDLLAQVGATGFPFATRNRCHAAGYESVGLFPIRLEGVTYGLIQCNDPRRDCFSAGGLALLEDLAQATAHLLQLAMA